MAPTTRTSVRKGGLEPPQDCSRRYLKPGAINDVVDLHSHEIPDPRRPVQCLAISAVPVGIDIPASGLISDGSTAPKGARR